MKSKDAAAQKEKPSHIHTEGETLNIGYTHTHALHSHTTNTFSTVTGACTNVTSAALPLLLRILGS